MKVCRCHWTPYNFNGNCHVCQESNEGKVQQSRDSLEQVMTYNKQIFVQSRSIKAIRLISHAVEAYDLEFSKLLEQGSILVEKQSTRLYFLLFFVCHAWPLPHALKLKVLHNKNNRPKPIAFVCNVIVLDYSVYSKFFFYFRKVRNFPVDS